MCHVRNSNIYIQKNLLIKCFKNFQVIKYNELIPAVVDWRRIAAKYSDYGVYPYSDHTPFVDQVSFLRC